MGPGEVAVSLNAPIVKLASKYLRLYSLLCLEKLLFVVGHG